MGNVKQTYEFDFEFNRKKIKQQLKEISGDVAELISSMGRASDKVTIFKDMTTYIENLDSAIAAFKSKNAGAISEVFDGLDADALKYVEKLFGVDGGNVVLFQELKKQVDALGKSGASLDKARKTAENINALLNSVGMSSKAIDLSIFDKGVMKPAQRLEEMNKALDQFVTGYLDFSKKIQGGIGAEGPVAGGGVSGGLAGENEEIKKQIDELEQQKKRYQEILDVFNGSKKINISMPKKNNDQIEYLRTLRDELKAADLERTKLEEAGEIGGPEYLQAVANSIEKASKVSAAFQHNNLTDGAIDWINSNMEPLRRAEAILSDFTERYKKFIPGIKKMYSTMIADVDSKLSGAQLNNGQGGPSGGVVGDKTEDVADQIKLYNTLRDSVQKYYNVLRERDKFNPGSDDYNRLDKELQNIIENVKKLKAFDKDQNGTLVDIFGDIEYENIQFRDTIESICALFEIQIPDSVMTATTKLQEFFNLVEAINIHPFDIFGNADGNVDVGRYTERLEATKAVLDALGEQGLLTAEELKSVEDAFNRSKENLESSTTHYDGYGNGYGNYNYDYYGEYQEQRDRADALERDNDQLREELDKRSSVDCTNLSMSDDELEDLRKENGTLEEKLELLRDIAEQYASTITQRYRSRYDELSEKDADSGLTAREEERYYELGEMISEADEDLENFETNYERIVLKLANGKKIEILPTDEGLRKFDKIANEYSDGEFNGIEIEDVEFVRQEQFLRTKIDSYEELCAVVKRYNELINKDTSGKEKIELQSLLDRIHATKGERTPDQMINDSISWSGIFDAFGGINSDRLAKYLGIDIPLAAEKAEQALESVAVAEDKIDSSNTKVESIEKKILPDTTHIDDVDVSKEIQDATLLLTKINEIKSAVEEKTQAFNNEQLAVDGVVTKEIESLKRLEEYLGTLKTVIDESVSTPINQWNEKIEALYGKIQQLGIEFKEINELITSLGTDLNMTDTGDGQRKFAVKMDTSDMEAALTTATGAISTKVDKVVGGMYTLEGAVNSLAGKMQDADGAQDADAERKQQIEYMKQNLAQFFSKVSEHNNRVDEFGQRNGQEIGAELFANGSISYGYGGDGEVDWDTIMTNILSNITNQPLMSIHSHPWGSFFGENLFGEVTDQLYALSVFSGSGGDLASFEADKQLGTKIGAMITGNILSALDVDKIGTNYEQFIRNLIDVENEYASNPKYADYVVGRDNDYPAIGQHSTLAEWHKNMDIFREIMFEALKRTGYSEEDVHGIYNEYDLTNDSELTALATTLVDLSASAKSATSQVDALRDLLRITGTSNGKDELQANASKLKNSMLSNDKMNVLFDLKDFEDKVHQYFGDLYNNELRAIRNAIISGSDDDRYNASDVVSNIVRGAGADIDLKEGQVALEALRRGEVTLTDVWNKFSSVANNIFQDAIDNVNVIDSKNQQTSELSNVSQILTEINGKVDAIVQNTSGDLQEEQIREDGDVKNANESNTDLISTQIVTALTNATTELKNVANGIVEEHKRKKVDTRDADARLADPKTREDIRTAALKAVEGSAVEGGKMDVTSMSAMTDGAVRVAGYVKTATDKWEGFTLQVNRAGEAVKLTWDANAKAAKDAEKLAKEAAVVAEEIKEVTESAKVDPNKKIADEIASNERARTLQKIIGQVNLEKGSLGFNFNARNLEPDQNEIVGAYDALIAEMDKYEIAIKNGQHAELDGIEKTKAALFEKIDAYKQANNIVNAGKTGNKKTPGATVVKNATTKFNALNNAVNTEELKQSSKVQKALSQYTTAYQKLVNLQNTYKVGQVLSKEQDQEFNDARVACNNYAKDLEKLLKLYQNAKSEGDSSKRYEFGGDFQDTDTGRQKVFKEFLDQFDSANVAFEKFDDNYNKMMFTVNNGDGTFTKMTASINSTRTAIDVFSGETKEAKSAIGALFDEIKGKFRTIFTYLTASVSWYEMWSVVKQGINYVREIDSALTELKKVTDETDASYDKFLQDMSKTGSVVGATVANLTTMAADWSRLGYSLADSAKLAESTAILLNVSEFDDATAASEALISTMQAFQYTADESQHVVDILNEVGKLLPVDNYIG